MAAPYGCGSDGSAGGTGNLGFAGSDSLEPTGAGGGSGSDPVTTGTGTGGSSVVGGAGGNVARDAGATGSGGTAVADAGRVEASAPTNVYYVSGTGLDTNPGTQDKPFFSLARAHQLAQAGTLIWVMPGKISYPVSMILTKSGTETNPIRVWAMPGARPVLDYSMETKGSTSARGIEVKGNYWHIRGLEIANTGDNCINISGSHNTVEDVIMHDCGDTGLQITVSAAQAADNTLGAYNTILNCDSYANLDATTGGENADGFAAKLQIGPGNVFRGCRAWNNADDGWDFFASNDVVVVDNCWAFLNGKTVSGKSNPQGDGNGFKLGGKPADNDPAQGGAVHQVTHSSSFENLKCGFVRNNNPFKPALSNCAARSNPTGDYCDLTCSPTITMAMTGAQAKAAARNADGSLPAIK
jgi:pectate disaccharide-lyase